MHDENSEPRPGAADARTLRIPPEGQLAATALLDAVISQSAGASNEANLQALGRALSILTPGELYPPEELPDAGDITAAAMVCISWLANKLAVTTGTSMEAEISELRAFLDSVAEH